MPLASPHIHLRAFKPKFKSDGMRTKKCFVLGHRNAFELCLLAPMQTLWCENKKQEKDSFSSRFIYFDVEVVTAYLI